ETCGRVRATRACAPLTFGPRDPNQLDGRVGQPSFPMPGIFRDPPRLALRLPATHLRSPGQCRLAGLIPVSWANVTRAIRAHPQPVPCVNRTIRNPILT